jgi:hypothetical protein
LPRSIAITTTRCVELTGVMTRSFRAARRTPPFGQAETQTPQPRHSSVSAAARFRPGCAGSSPGTSRSASTGQAFAHVPQPSHLEPSSSTTKLVVCTGRRKPKRFAASMASQPQPQQLQTKAGVSRTFSPNWTRRRSWTSARMSSPSEADTGLAKPCFASERAVAPKVRQTSRGASHARPTCSILCRQ